MKKFITVLILTTLLFIPNIYGEEYKYYDIDISTQEKFEHLSDDEYHGIFFLDDSGAMIRSNRKTDDGISIYNFDKNGTLLWNFEIGSLSETNPRGTIVKYEIGKNAPDVFEHLFTEEDKAFINDGEFDLNYLSNYDGIRLILKENLEYTSDKKCDSVCIDKVKVLDRTNRDVTKSEPKFEGLELDLDLSFEKVEDSVKYEVNINNPTDKDYEVSTPEKSSEGDNITYEYTFKDDDNILKANSNKTMYVTVRYNKKVEEASFVDGVFKEENKAVIKLSNGVEETPIDNKPVEDVKVPDTYAGISIFIIFGLIALLGYLSYNKLSSKLLLLLIPLLLIPVIVNAYERLEVKVNTSVEIKEKKNILMERPIPSEARLAKEDLNNLKSVNNSVNHYNPIKQETIFTASDGSLGFWNYTYNIKTITFENKIREINNYAYKLDISKDQDNSIIAYLIENGKSVTKSSEEVTVTLVDVYIMADGEIYANPNSKGWFADFINLEHIYNINLLNTSLVTDMSYMFYDCRSLAGLDVSSFDINKVTNMDKMFCGCNKLNEFVIPDSFSPSSYYCVSNEY